MSSRDERPESDLKLMVELLLHELRTPVSVAQGYLRLLLEDRLHAPDERRHAIERSMDALGRIASTCLTAGDYLSETPPPLSRYRATRLAAALQARAAEHGMTCSLSEAIIPGDVAFLPPDAGAGALLSLLGSLRSTTLPILPPMVHISVHRAELVLTTGDLEAHHRLLDVGDGPAIDPWRGRGLLAPLAMLRLAHTGLRTWTLTEPAEGQAVAIPLKGHA